MYLIRYKIKKLSIFIALWEDIISKINEILEIYCHFYEILLERKEYFLFLTKFENFNFIKLLNYKTIDCISNV